MTRLDSDKTLTDALAERDTLALKRSVIASLVEATTVRFNRLSRSEIKFYPTVDVANYQKELDRLAKQYRELDTRIQEANWDTELVEE
jgi:hypothetical protein